MNAKSIVCLLEAGLSRRNFIHLIARAASASGLAGPLTPKVVVQLAKAVSPKNRLTIAAIGKIRSDAEDAAYTLLTGWLGHQAKVLGKDDLVGYQVRNDPEFKKLYGAARETVDALRNVEIGTADLAAKIVKSKAFQVELAKISDEEVAAAATAELQFMDDPGDGEAARSNRYTADEVVSYWASGGGRDDGGNPEVQKYRQEYRASMALSRVVSSAFGCTDREASDLFNLAVPASSMLGQRLTFQDFAAKGLISPQDASNFEEQAMQAVAFAANNQKKLDALKDRAFAHRAELAKEDPNEDQAAPETPDNLEEPPGNENDVF